MHDEPAVQGRPVGPRAALAYGPDICEIAKFLGEIDERGPAALDAAAEIFALDASKIATAVSYYASYPDEIDAEVSDAGEASARAEEAWRVQRRLICMSRAATELVLDEVFSPAIAAVLRASG